MLKHKGPMKLVVSAAITLLYFGLDLMPLPAQALKPDDFRARMLNFDTVDYSTLVTEARRYYESPDGELEALVRSNFQFIFLNQLNRRSFLATPSPEEVISKIQQLIQMNDQMTGLVEEGRRNAVGPQDRLRQRQIVREVRDLAQQMKKLFNQYFLEVRRSSYRISFTVFDVDTVQFVHFLLQVDRINKYLSDEIQAYFFNRIPGQIDVSRLDTSSIAVLCESVVVLSSMTENRLN